MASYEIASQLLDYQFKLAAEKLAGVQATQAFMTDVYLYANILAVVVQFFLVGFVLKRFGLTTALLILPLAMPVLIFGARTVSLAAAGDAYGAGVYALAAYAVGAMSLAPYATAAALRISNG